jgi:enoyl-CoA hydratase/carnithine racemase
MTEPVRAARPEDTMAVRSEISGAVLWLTLARPDRGNALSRATMQELTRALKVAEADSAIRVIVIAAEGRIFSAGHDIFEMEPGGGEAAARAAQREVLEVCRDLMLTIMRLDKPVIASVQGIATAGGAQLVSACDLAVAAESARFCTPGVNFGGFCTTPLIGIGRNIHRKHAMEMALTGDLFSAGDAYRFGLVNRVVPDDLLRAETEALARNIARRGPEGIRQGKAAFYAQAEMPIDDAYILAIDKMIDACACDDAREGLAALQRKEKPRWDRD